MQNDIYEICKVCGDRASNCVYYGGRCCPCCRQFFRRSVVTFSRYYLYMCNKTNLLIFNRIFLHTTRILFEYSTITGHQIIPIPVYAKKNVPIMKIHSAQSKKKQEVSLVNIADFKSV